ncbi:MAG TPA: glycosyltransferase family 2 protein [Candidatus Saccharimonadales bacterium]|nr:glycosyltransferase family 2 protein [Candidatus Saccharimonadales bacterium]
MSNKKTVSICIPAYNEEHNMDNILKQVYSQTQKEFVIEQVVVVSDGSTDNTVKIAQKYKNLGVKIIEGRVNRGQTCRQNEIIALTSSDILVLLNADLLLGDNEVIARLIDPILNGADLSAQWARPLPPHTFMERILYAGFELKYFVYKHHKNGNNIYTCVGHMRALSRKFYSHVTFPKVSDGEDQYLYLACIKGGYRYEYTHASNVYFKLPDNFEDYKKYAVRIFQTQKKFGDVFSEELVRSERALPLDLRLRGCIYALLKYPFYTLPYILLHIVMQRWALIKPLNSSYTFDTAASTKNFAIANDFPNLTT